MSLILPKFHNHVFYIKFALCKPSFRVWNQCKLFTYQVFFFSVTCPFEMQLISTQPDMNLKSIPNVFLLIDHYRTISIIQSS